MPSLNIVISNSTRHSSQVIKYSLQMPGDYKKYIPSAEVGEYEQYRNKEKKKGGLYPLNEEGEYGPPPSALPPPLPGH